MFTGYLVLAFHCTFSGLPGSQAAAAAVASPATPGGRRLVQGEHAGSAIGARQALLGASAAIAGRRGPLGTLREARAASLLALGPTALSRPADDADDAFVAVADGVAGAGRASLAAVLEAGAARAAGRQLVPRSLPGGCRRSSAISRPLRAAAPAAAAARSGRDDGRRGLGRGRGRGLGGGQGRGRGGGGGKGRGGNSGRSLGFARAGPGTGFPRAVRRRGRGWGRGRGRGQGRGGGRGRRRAPARRITQRSSGGGGGGRRQRHHRGRHRSSVLFNDVWLGHHGRRGDHTGSCRHASRAGGRGCCLARVEVHVAALALPLLLLVLLLVLVVMLSHRRGLGDGDEGGAGRRRGERRGRQGAEGVRRRRVEAARGRRACRGPARSFTSRPGPEPGPRPTA